MGTDITRQPLSLILVQFVLFLLLFWVRYSYFPQGCEQVPDMLTQVQAALSQANTTPIATEATPEYISPGVIINRLAERFPLMAEAIAALLLFIIGFIITKTMSINLVFPARTYLPYLIYILAAGGIYFPGDNLAAILAAYFIVRASAAFINSYFRTRSLGTTFKGAFFIGIAPLLHSQTAIYLILIPVAMRMFRKNNRETIVTILGSIFPALIMAYSLWAMGGNFTDVYISIWDNFTTITPITISAEPLEIVRLSVAILFILTVILSAVSFMATASDMRTHAYKIQSFMFVFLIIGAASLALPSRSVGDLPTLAIPIAFITPAYFVKYPSPWATAIYSLLLCGIVGLNILPFVL